MKLFISLIFLASSHVVFAQFGVGGAWQSLRADDWHQFAESQSGISTPAATGYGIGLDYWFRWKKKRIEFLPELNYARHNLEVEGGKFKHRMLSFYFNVNVYPFDFESDCDCPTWSKTGNFFTKGFYLQFSPGVSGMKNQVENSLKFEDETIAFAIGGGAGVDIGLSDFLTITPFFKYHYYPKAIWQDLPNHQAELTDVESKLKLMSVGIRLGFRNKKSR